MELRARPINNAAAAAAAAVAELNAKTGWGQRLMLAAFPELVHRGDSLGAMLGSVLTVYADDLCLLLLLGAVVFGVCGCWAHKRQRGKLAKNQ